MKTWHLVAEKRPCIGQIVIARYKGVYQDRVCTYWEDATGTPHFGLPTEPDGKGSQPAEEWREQ